MMATATCPTTRNIEQIVSESLGLTATTITRFPTGLCHYVFDIQTSEGQEIVVRIAHPEHRSLLVQSLFWTEKLRPLGIPLPAVLASNLDGEWPFQALERLPGTDLGNVYQDLSSHEKKELAGQIVDIQNKVHALPHGLGYGFASDYEDPKLGLHQSWLEVLHEHLDRSEAWINETGLCDVSRLELVHAAVLSHRRYFDSVLPIAFLDDTTTKNVIVAAGKLSGIVDVDAICFGDPLFTTALTNMSLLSSGYDTEYIDHWTEHLCMNPAREKALTIYTAMFCVCFMGEVGKQFNKAEASADLSRIARLDSILSRLLPDL